VLSAELPNDSARPLPHCDTNTSTTKDSREKGLMEAIRPKRAGWRALKFKRRQRRLSKRSGTPQPETMDDNESAQAEEIDRLLLSSLRFWEVERDLIEERMAAISR